MRKSILLCATILICIHIPLLSAQALYEIPGNVRSGWISFEIPGGETVFFSDPENQLPPLQRVSARAEGMAL